MEVVFDVGDDIGMWSLKGLVTVGGVTGGCFCVSFGVEISVWVVVVKGFMLYDGS